MKDLVRVVLQTCGFKFWVRLVEGVSCGTHEPLSPHTSGNGGAQIQLGAAIGST